MSHLKSRHPTPVGEPWLAHWSTRRLVERNPHEVREDSSLRCQRGVQAVVWVRRPSEQNWATAQGDGNMNTSSEPGGLTRSDGSPSKELANNANRSPSHKRL